MLEADLIARTVAAVTQAAGLEETPVDAQAKTDAREAVRATAEQGDAEERRALAMIAKGDLTSGLRRLSDLASASTIDVANQWRRIGRLAWAFDTGRALAAYQRVVALDQSDPWDSIYLGLLYQRVGKLREAKRTYADALARLPEANERERAILLNETGDVLATQGDLSRSLESYLASLAILKGLTEADPSNALWQHDLSVSLRRHRLRKLGSGGE